jgi:hypothetical protein
MKITSARVLVAALVLSLAAVASAAKKNKSTDDGGVHAKIMGVGGNGKLIVQVMSTDGTNKQQTVVLQTNDSTTVEIDGQPAKLSDLQAGEMAVLQGDPSGVVTDIKANKAKGKRVK